MNYDLWDIGTGSAMAFYQVDSEMATLVQSLAGDYGAGFADDLHLTIKDDAGAVHGKLTGPALLAWAEEVKTGGSEPTTDRGGGLISSTGRSSTRGIAATSVPRSNG